MAFADAITETLIFAFKLGVLMSVVLVGALLIGLAVAFWPGPHGVDRWQP